MCENMRSYSHVKDEERDGSKVPPSIGVNSDEYKQYIKNCRAARKGGRTWKDDYLALCIYVRAGAPQIFTACVCGISPGQMSDIFHFWAQSSAYTQPNFAGVPIPIH